MDRFLEKLESKIILLEEKERKKILKRYQQKITEQMKEGKSLKEAIASLGTMDDIVAEIYAEYHLNVTYSTSKKTFGEKVNSWIGSAANFLSDTVEETIRYATSSNGEHFLYTFFEILLKILLLVLAFLLMKIPFYLLQGLIESICNLLFYPFDSALIGLSNFVLSVIYFILCVFLGVFLFKGYGQKSIAKKKSVQVESEKPIEEVSPTKKKHRNYALLFIKMILYIVVIVPMIFLTLAFLILTLLAVFFVWKGVSILGLVAILFGYFLLSLLVTVYLTDAVDNRHKSHAIFFVSTIFILIFGHFWFIENLMSFQYPKTLEESSFQPKVETVTLSVEKDTFIKNLEGDLEVITDNEMVDNEILLEISYYDELYDCIITEDETEDLNYVLIYTIHDKFETTDISYLYENILEDLKDNRIHDYNQLSGVTVTLRGNEKTLEFLERENQ